MAVQRTGQLNKRADVECNGETVKVIPKDSFISQIHGRPDFKEEHISFYRQKVVERLSYRRQKNM